MWKGFAYAAGAAIGHSCIDASRKWASQRFSTIELVALVGLVDALLLAFLALVLGHLGGGDAGGAAHFSLLPSVNNEFLVSLFITAALKLLAGLMYQRALFVSPLSVTVPYLAFTPVLLVFTSYILIGEVPSSLGLLGVVIVTLGGYFLSLEHHAAAGAGGVDVELKRKPPLVSAKLISLLPWAADKPSLKSLEQIKVDSTLDVAGDRSLFSVGVSKLRSCWPRFEWEEGSILMLGVAGLLSIGNSLDKMAAHMASSVVVFAALQRGIIAIPAVLYLLLTSPKSFKHLMHHLPMLLAISMFEVTAFICYLKSLEVLLVSYSVAAKRSNVLLSVLIGSYMFKEKIWSRLPFILMMVLGMTLILFA